LIVDMCFYSEIQTVVGVLLFNVFFRKPT
jgi:hypothetical protein